MKWLGIFICVIFLVGCSTEKRQIPDWVISPSFESQGTMLRGVADHLAILDTPFIVGEKQENIWHFWGVTAELAGKLTVKAVHQDTGQTITLIERVFMVPVKPLNGADNHTATLMSLPVEGLWRLDAYINSQFFGSVIVQAQ